MKAAAWVLTLLVAGIMAAFRLYIGPKLEALAGGLPNLDSRIAGYSVSEARAYLAALSPEGVAFYLGPFHQLDFMFPAALALWLLIPLRGLQAGWKLLWLVPLCYAVCDYAENLSVRVMLQDSVTDGFIARTALLSQAKWAFALLALALSGIVWIKRRT